MKCKSCKREIVENSIFCSWCGCKQIKEKKQKDEISVPKPVKRGNRWTIQLRAEGWSTTENTAEECIIKAKAYRAGFLEKKKDLPKLTVGQCIDKYISDIGNTLSPSTLKEYKSCKRNHYDQISSEDVYTYNWQQYVNNLAASKSAKTVENIWHLMASAMRYNKVSTPDVSLPKKPVSDTPFLTYEQIGTLLNELYDKPGELEAILALHSLRRSEILALTRDSFDRDRNIIIVHGAKVVGEEGLVYKEQNKSRTSTRNVPVMNERLWQLLPDSGGFIITTHQNTLIKRINAACRRCGLPEVGVHGLRRSFASLAYHLHWDERTVMQIGGWNNLSTVHQHYIKLASEDINRQTESMKEFYKSL